MTISGKKSISVRNVAQRGGTCQFDNFWVSGKIVDDQEIVRRFEVIQIRPYSLPWIVGKPRGNEWVFARLHLLVSRRAFLNHVTDFW